MTKRSLACSVVVATLLVGALAASSGAHSSTTYYPAFWQSSLDVHWKFEEAVPATLIRERIKDGADKWTNLSPVMNFVKDSGDYANFAFSSCPNDYQKNGVHWENIDGAMGTIASVRRCLVSNEIFTFQMRYDSSESWYNLLDTPTDSDKYDSLAAATHEFGHATGFSGPYSNGHFDPTADICTGVQQTMCPGTSKGNWNKRTLEEHDTHTFTNQYP